MPLTPRQHIIHAMGHGTEGAIEDLQAQLASLPDVRVVALSNVVRDVEVRGFGGSGVAMSTIVAVVEEV